MDRPIDAAAGDRDGESSSRPGSSWVTGQIAELASAWERGEPYSVASLLADHPDLETESALRLIYEEVCLRRESGEECDTDEVLRQYPRWASELQDLLDCDRLLRPLDAHEGFPEVGETLGPFVLLEQLGRGASGRTYLATDPTLANRPVVVKVIPDNQDEHLALAALRHTHIVPLFSEHTFPERGLRGLCMPYLGGTTLAEILKAIATVPPTQRSGRLIVQILDGITTRTALSPLVNGPFRRGLEPASYVQAITWIVSCLADALQYAHALGMVHMDVKPSNVLIAGDGQPMLLDFHLSRGPIVAGATVTDRIGGTPGWMSPEHEAAMEAVTRGRPIPSDIDGRTDVYALGLVLREALASPGKSDPARTGAPPWFERAEGVTLGLADIIRKCLAPKPRERYPNAAALAEDLRRELNDLPLRGVRNRSPLELGRKWRSRHPGTLAWGAAALVGLVAMTLVGGVLVADHQQRVRQVQRMLDDARRDREDGQYDQALRVLDRARDMGRGLTGAASLRADLDDERRRSLRGQMAGELHDLADLIRFQHGVELPSADDARALEPVCRELWQRWSTLWKTELMTLPAEIEQRARADLVEVVAVWADLQLLLASDSAQNHHQAQRDVARLLDEAESLSRSSSG